MAAGRRWAPPIPSGDTPPPDRAWKLLLQLWRYSVNQFAALPAPHEAEHLVGGSDSLQTPGLPIPITLANTAGTPAIGAGPSFARENHSHGAIKRDVRVKAAGSDVGTRNAISFSSAFSVTDNPGSDRVDVALNGLSPVDLEFLSWVL